jgi:hypothetical protein
MKSLFEKTIRGPWTKVGLDTQYRFWEEDDGLHLAFQGSVSRQDWKDNLNFAATPYRDQATPWRAHRGFVRVWKDARDAIVSDSIGYDDDQPLTISGYSHGGGITVLAHEFFWFHGRNPTSFSFGGPRVMHRPPQAIQDRFVKFALVKVNGDLVTHAPLLSMGYRHVGRVIAVGPERWLPRAKYHYKDQYLQYL